MLSWQQLRDLDCSRLTDAADGWGKVSNRADAARDRVDAEMTGRLAKTQEGEAAQVVVRRLRRLNRNFAYLYTECGLIRSMLNGLAHELQAPQKRLKGALEDAASLNFTVNTNGSVSYPPAGEDLTQGNGSKHPGGSAAGRGSLFDPRPPSPDGRLLPGGGTPLLPALNPNHAKAEAIADRIAHALCEANDIDGRFSRALNKLRAEPGLTVNSATWTDAAGDADAVRDIAYKYLKDDFPQDKSPAERKAWWDSLSPERREEYLAVYPDLIGNLDGIPAEVRDRANRDNLRLLIGQLEGQDDDKSRTMLAALKDIDRQLAENVRDRLELGKEPPPPMYLLGISDEGNGRAIVSYGNPDTSRNVSAFVPGLGSKLDTAFTGDDGLKRALDTARGAQRYDPSTASIAWLGYDAPQLPAESLANNTDIALTGNAKAGASSYNEFMAGISATNETPDPRVTAIGHSYGSLTVGQAAQQPGGITGADNIILVGSPGTGANSAQDLNVDQGHVFVGAADNDLVTKAPSKEHTAAALAFPGPIGVAVGQVADPGNDNLWFGRDPASEAFGATRFEVNNGPHVITGGVDAHTNYFDPKADRVSADNIARIVAGEPNIKTEERR
ncbi:alpha/beta hydrolase [Streptomyces apocyni]|uniref:alpha/beta hydrolase n=1 Tax=Streptomyces apocyni TaxID=2654677 RepID=UPI001E3535EA|nr:alpha/beta hydrolase [Streptomyces apocyni]